MPSNVVLALGQEELSYAVGRMMEGADAALAVERALTENNPPT
jgi:hypothetical protein